MIRIIEQRGSNIILRKCRSIDIHIPVMEKVAKKKACIFRAMLRDTKIDKTSCFPETRRCEFKSRLRKEFKSRFRKTLVNIELEM